MREREAQTQAEGEAGSMQGARRGTRSWVSRITPWAKGGAKLLSHPSCPEGIFFFFPEGISLDILLHFFPLGTGNVIFLVTTSDCPFSRLVSSACSGYGSFDAHF